MSRQSDGTDYWDTLRAKIIGLGERSIKKSYYPELQQRLADLERFRTLLDQSNDCIFLAETPSGNLVDVNESACHQLGYERGELLAKSFLDMMMPSEAKVICGIFSGKKMSRQNVQITSMLFKKNGYELPVEMTIRLVELSSTVYAVAVARDITERRHAEETLRQNENKYRALIETTGTGYVILDSAGNVLDANQEYVRLTRRRNLSGIVGRNVQEWTAGYDREKSRQAHMQIVQEGSVRNLEIDYVDAQGSITPVEINATLVDLDGKARSLCLCRDISGRRRDEEEKKQLEFRLTQAQKMEAIGTLAGGIAHDFNNILSAILGYAELALLNLSEPAKAGSQLKEVLRAGDRAKDLVGRILTFSRKTDIRYAPMELSTAIKEPLRMLRSFIPSTIEINEELSESGFILSEPTQIHQVVMNLCTNAAQAMDENGGTLYVGLERARLDAASASALDIPPGPYFMITVRDTGKGIPPDILKHIFEPYFTTKEKGSGTGLGLAVVHGIVKSHGGAVTCRSIPGKGTTFQVYLPEIESKIGSMEYQEAFQYPTGSERILYVDDEKVLVDLADSMLSTLGYKLTKTTSSLEALERFRENPHAFDLVITDMTMPGMTGEKLAQRLLEIRPDIPIILCTGYNEHITDEIAKKIGIRRFIMKPLDMKDLSKTIRSVLDGNRE